VSCAARCQSSAARWRPVHGARRASAASDSALRRGAHRPARRAAPPHRRPAPLAGGPREGGAQRAGRGAQSARRAPILLLPGARRGSRAAPPRRPTGRAPADLAPSASTQRAPASWEAAWQACSCSGLTVCMCQCTAECCEEQTCARAARMRPRLNAEFCIEQDEEYLYLVMEYLPGGDVMVRLAGPLRPATAEQTCRGVCVLVGRQGHRPRGGSNVAQKGLQRASVGTLWRFASPTVQLLSNSGLPIRRPAPCMQHKACSGAAL